MNEGRERVVRILSAIVPFEIKVLLLFIGIFLHLQK